MDITILIAKILGVYLIVSGMFLSLAFVFGGIFYCFLGRQRRGVRANLRVVTGRRRAERLQQVRQSPRGR